MWRRCPGFSKTHAKRKQLPEVGLWNTELLPVLDWLQLMGLVEVTHKGLHPSLATDKTENLLGPEGLLDGQQSF